MNCGKAVQYAYDEMDRLSGVTGIDGQKTAYEYDLAGNRTKTESDHFTTEYEYDKAGRVTRKKTTGETTAEFSYAYDANGNMAQEKRVENGKTYNRTYYYDLAQQLTGFAENDYAERYTYDAAGNMTQKTAGGIRTEMKYNAANQLTSLTSQNGTVEYSYDANGNLILSHMDDKVNTYSYDATGRLKWYTGHDGYEERYTYDAAGNRVKKETRGKSERKTLEELAQMNIQLNRGAVEEEAGAGEAGGSAQWTQTEYVNDVTRENAEVLMERTGAKTTYYEYGLERISAQEKEWFAERKTEYVYDGRGSVAQEYSYNNAWYNYWFAFTQGREVESKRYTPYGESITAKVSGYGYNGEYYSAETGQQYLRMRYYDPSMMRFSQKDIVRGEIGDAQNVNRYAYVKNDPISYTDPSGMSAISGIGIGAAVGGMVGGALGGLKGNAGSTTTTSNGTKPNYGYDVVHGSAAFGNQSSYGSNADFSASVRYGREEAKNELYNYVQKTFEGHQTRRNDGVPEVKIDGKWVKIVSYSSADSVYKCMEDNTDEYNDPPSNVGGTISRNLPANSKPNSNLKQYKDGNLYKERWYGPDGKAIKDRHYTNHGNSKKHPKVPHDHDWEENEDGEWTLGPSYDPDDLEDDDPVKDYMDNWNKYQPGPIWEWGWEEIFAKNPQKIEGGAPKTGDDSFWSTIAHAVIRTNN